MRQIAELRQRQKQAFNTRFSTAVRILQMSGAELAEEIRDILDANPLLEEVDRTVSDNHDDVLFRGELPPAGLYSTDFDSEDMLDYAAHHVDNTSIRDHLAQQVLASGLTEKERITADAIIESIDDRGYLTESIDDIVDYLSNTVDRRQVEVVLSIVQQYDPPGIAARNLQECLFNQLDSSGAPATIKENARTILRDHLELLSEMRLELIGAEMKCDAKSIRSAVDLIQSLNPTPASRFGSAALAVAPDVIARKIKERWVVELNSMLLPKLRISDSYRAMFATRINSEERKYLNNNLSSANTFLDSLSRRHETILRVAESVVNHQVSFLEHGDHAMKSLTLQQVAETLDLHESTVSRACAGKYIMTPRGTFELKHFFSNRIRSDIGEDESAISIKHKIRQIVDSEDRQAPLSDQKITQRMRESGIHIARRTIAKYRSEMHIPSCKIRKSIAMNKCQT